MSYCNFFNKPGGNQGEPLGEEIRSTYDPDFDRSSVRTKVQEGFHTLVSTETGEPIVGTDPLTGEFYTANQKASYDEKMKSQLSNDPVSRRGKLPESFQDRQDRLSFNDPTGKSKRRLLQISEENDRIARSGFSREFPEGTFLSFEKAEPPNSNLPDIADLIRSQPANPDIVPPEYKAPEFQSNREVIPDSGKNLGDIVRTENLSSTTLKPTSGTQLDTDDIGPKPVKVKQNSNDAKSALLTEDDLDERSIGEVAGSVAGKVLGLAGLAAGVGATLSGKGSTKQKAEDISEQTGGVVAQEAGSEGIKRLELTKRYRNLSQNQKDIVDKENKILKRKEGRFANNDEIDNMITKAENIPPRAEPNTAPQTQNNSIVQGQEKTQPSMNSESDAASDLGSGTEVKFQDTSDAFSQGGANSEASGMGQSVAKNPESKAPTSGGGEEDTGDVIEKSAADGLEEAGEIDAIGLGPEDPIGDVISGIFGVGTLLGGIFGDKPKNVQPKLPPPPNVEQAVQLGVDI